MTIADKSQMLEAIRLGQEFKQLIPTIIKSALLTGSGYAYMINLLSLKDKSFILFRKDDVTQTVSGTVGMYINRQSSKHQIGALIVEHYSQYSVDDEFEKNLQEDHIHTKTVREVLHHNSMDTHYYLSSIQSPQEINIRRTSPNLLTRTDSYTNTDLKEALIDQMCTTLQDRVVIYLVSQMFRKEDGIQFLRRYFVLAVHHIDLLFRGLIQR